MADSTPDLARKCPSARAVTGWTVFFMVLLRISIGWHLAYEGMWKLDQEDWRATGFLVRSTGPLRNVFRAMVPDAEGLERLTPEAAKAAIDERFELLTDFYDLKPMSDEAIAQISDPERKAAEAEKARVYKDLEKWRERKKNVVWKDPEKKTQPEDPICVDVIFADPDFQKELDDYKVLLTEIEAREKTQAPAFNTERLEFSYGKKAQARQALLARAYKPLRFEGKGTWRSLEGYILAGLNTEQLAKGRAPGDKSPTWLIDWANMLSLSAVGICLILGLCTRLAAFGGTCMLLMYYFAMPPFPGLPATNMGISHYLIVNTNLIEAFALLMIMTSGVGRWAGLDAYLGAWWDRKCQPAEAAG